VHLLIFLAEPLAFKFVLDFALDEVTSLPARGFLSKASFVTILDSLEESATRFPRRGKGLRSRF